MVICPLESIDKVVRQTSTNVVVVSLHSRGCWIAKRVGCVKSVNDEDRAEIEMVIRGRRRICKSDFWPLGFVTLVRTWQHVHALQTERIGAPYKVFADPKGWSPPLLRIVRGRSLAPLCPAAEVEAIAQFVERPGLCRSLVSTAVVDGAIVHLSCIAVSDFDARQDMRRFDAEPATHNLGY